MQDWPACISSTVSGALTGIPLVAKSERDEILRLARQGVYVVNSMTRNETTKYSVRQASASDAAVIAGHRVNMFRDMGQVPTDELAVRLHEASTAALRALLQAGSYVGWLAITESDRVLAGAGAHVRSQLPRVSHDGIEIATAPVPLVVNVYTESDVRGRGIARALMNKLLEWAKDQGCDRVLLHASAAGRPLYESLGFVPTNEMRWSPGFERFTGKVGRDFPVGDVPDES